MRRARPSDRISEFVPQGDRVLIGVRDFQGSACLVVKMSQRKNLPWGCILKRVCLCHDPSPQARKICPTRRTWPLIRERAGVGVFFFSLSLPKITPTGFLRQLR